MSKSLAAEWGRYGMRVNELNQSFFYELELKLKFRFLLSLIVCHPGLSRLKEHFRD